MSSSFQSRIIPVLFLLLALTVTVPLSSNAATINVKFGEDLSQKIKDASAGDTILVDPGTYTGPKATGFVIDKSLTLKASNPDNPPTLTVPSGSNINVAIISDNVTVDGFIVTRGHTGIWAIDFLNTSGGVLSGLNIRNLNITTDTSGDGHGISFDGVRDSVIDNCIVTQAHDNGIFIFQSNNVIVMNSKVQNTVLQHGLAVKDGDSVFLLDNTVSGSAFHGIIILGSKNCRIERNNVSGTQVDGITLSDDPTASLSGSSFNLISQNTVVSNGFANGRVNGTGIWLNSESNGNFVFANDISGFPENGHSIWVSSNNYAVGNVIHGNKQGGLFIWNAPGQSVSTGNTPVNNVVHNNYVFDNAQNAQIHLKGTGATDVGYNFLSGTTDAGSFKVGHPGDSTANVTNAMIYENIAKDFLNNTFIYENVSSTSLFRNRHFNITNTFTFSPSTVTWDAGSFIGGNYWSGHTATGNPSQTTPYTNIIHDAPGNKGIYQDRFPFESENLGKTYGVVVYEPYADSRVAAGSVKTIRWKSQGCVVVDITINSSAGSLTIATNYPDIGYYRWIVPTLPTANDYQITVSCKNSAGVAVGATGTSGVFSIASSALKLASPGRAFRGAAGSNVRVAWLKSSSVSDVDVYLKHSGGDWALQGSSSGTFMDITLPGGVSSNQASVRIVDQGNPVNQDSVDGYFTIRGSSGTITSIFAPDGGNVLSGSFVQIGDSYIIEWISPANSKTVDISFWDGTKWNLMAQNLPDFGRYTWFVPESPTTNSSIMIDFKDSSGSSLGTTQSSSFNIVFVAPSVPDITANGSDGPVTLSASDTLIVDISLDAVNSNNADWWLAADTPLGWFYFDVGTMSWVFAGPSPLDILVTLQSPLFDISPPFEVLNIAASVLPKGTTKFYFAIDTDMNGILDFDKLVFDLVKVVRP